MSEPLFDGHTSPVVKTCIRCGREHTDQFYQLCEICREGDRLAEIFSPDVADLHDEDFTDFLRTRQDLIEAGHPF